MLGLSLSIPSLALRRRGEGGGPLPPRPWVPSDLGAKLVFWGSAKAGGSLVLSGSNVQQWNDAGGSGRFVQQVTAGLQPVLEPAGLLDQPCLAFSADRLAAASAWWTTTEHNAFLFGAFATDSDLLGTGAVATSGDILIMRFGGIFRGHFWTAPAARDGTVQLGAGFRCLHQQVQGGQMATFLDASPASAPVAAAGAGTKTLHIAARSGAASGSGLFAHVVITTALTSDEKALVEGFGFHDYGMAASLPAGHPYKAAAPTI